MVDTHNNFSAETFHKISVELGVGLDFCCFPYANWGKTGVEAALRLL